MTAKEIEAGVKRILGGGLGVYCHADSGTVRIDTSESETTIAYQQLRALADFLGSDDIVLAYTADEGPYSDVTPGSPSDFHLMVRGVHIDFTPSS